MKQYLIANNKTQDMIITINLKFKILIIEESFKIFR
jgi:hypothetical protein